MKESVLKTNMVEMAKRADGYGRRYEDQYSVGTPDCHFIIPGCVPCWAEIKVFTGNVFGPTARQWIELQRIQKAGGIHVATCVIGYNGEFWIANPQKQINIKETEPLWHGMDFVETLRRFLSD